MPNTGSIKYDIKDLISGTNYFSSTSLSIYIGGMEGLYNSGEKMEFSYIQFAPQQNVAPVYNVFSTLPSLMLRGNSIVRGVIGLNFQLSTYMTSLEAASKVEDSELNYIGAIATKYKKPKVYDDYLIYVPHMRIEFVNDLSIKIGDNESPRMVVPTISMFDIYFSGGVISVAPDGSPVQDVYQYIAKKQLRKDMPIEINASDLNELREV